MEKLIVSTRAMTRLVVFILIVLAYLGSSYLFHFIIKDPSRRQDRFTKNTGFFAGLGLKLFGIQLNVINKPVDSDKFLIVSNHMGFLDILLISSTIPTVFVTSVEMRETPFLGLLTEMGGCVYVERRSRERILEELHSLVAALKQGFRIVLFPEATSTNGERVLPFKRTLMMAAAHAGVPIQPIVINYRKVNDEEFSLKWRDHICWYGDMSFHSSLWRCLKLTSVKAEIEFLEKIHATVEDDRKIVADKAHAMISERFVPVNF